MDAEPAIAHLRLAAEPGSFLGDRFVAALRFIDHAKRPIETGSVVVNAMSDRAVRVTEIAEQARTETRWSSSSRRRRPTGWRGPARTRRAAGGRRCASRRRTAGRWRAPACTS